MEPIRRLQSGITFLALPVELQLSCLKFASDPATLCSALATNKALRAIQPQALEAFCYERWPDSAAAASTASDTVDDGRPPWKNIIQTAMLMDSAAKVTPDPRSSFNEQVTEARRAILVEWLLEVSSDWRLDGAAPFLAIRFLDSFLAVRSLSDVRMLQLVGACCLRLAIQAQHCEQGRRRARRAPQTQRRQVQLSSADSGGGAAAAAADPSSSSPPASTSAVSPHTPRPLPPPPSSTANHTASSDPRVTSPERAACAGSSCRAHSRYARADEDSQEQETETEAKTGWPSASRAADGITVGATPQHGRQPQDQLPHEDDDVAGQRGAVGQLAEAEAEAAVAVAGAAADAAAAMEAEDEEVESGPRVAASRFADVCANTYTPADVDRMTDLIDSCLRLGLRSGEVQPYTARPQPLLRTAPTARHFLRSLWAAGTQNRAAVLEGSFAAAAAAVAAGSDATAAADTANAAAIPPALRVPALHLAGFLLQLSLLSPACAAAPPAAAAAAALSLALEQVGLPAWPACLAVGTRGSLPLSMEAHLQPLRQAMAAAQAVLAAPSLRSAWVCQMGCAARAEGEVEAAAVGAVVDAGGAGGDLAAAAGEALERASGAAATAATAALRRVAAIMRRPGPLPPPATGGDA